MYYCFETGPRCVAWLARTRRYAVFLCILIKSVCHCTHSWLPLESFISFICAVWVHKWNVCQGTLWRSVNNLQRDLSFRQWVLGTEPCTPACQEVPLPTEPPQQGSLFFFLTFCVWERRKWTRGIFSCVSISLHFLVCPFGNKWWNFLIDAWIKLHFVQTLYFLYTSAYITRFSLYVQLWDGSETDSMS